MKMLNFIMVAIVIAILFSACKKEEGASAEEIQKAEQFKSFITSKKFQLKEYYSDIPIDYIKDDEEIKSETNLWPYVSLWIKDDFNVLDLNSSKISITQNAHKIASDASDVMTRDFSIGADKDGAYFYFLTYQYTPLKYHIVNFESDEFTLYVDWHSVSRVYSKFVIVP